MAAPTLAQIRQGIATNLSTLSGAPANVQISPYMLGSPQPPTIQVMGPDEIDYDIAMQRGADEWRIIVQGFVGAATDIGAQVNLDEWLAPAGALSVKAAIESDRTLGGSVMDSYVESASGYKLYTLDSQAQVLGAEWTVRLLAAGH